MGHKDYFYKLIGKLSEEERFAFSFSETGIKVDMKENGIIDGAELREKEINDG